MPVIYKYIRSEACIHLRVRIFNGLNCPQKQFLSSQLHKKFTQPNDKLDSLTTTSGIILSKKHINVEDRTYWKAGYNKK